MRKDAERERSHTARPHGDLWETVLNGVPRCIFCGTPRGIKCHCCDPTRLRLRHG